MAGWRNISEFLALRRNTSLLLVALVLAGTGEKLWLGFAPKYIEVLAHGVLSAAQIILVIGIFDALQTFLGAVYAYPGGWLTDHWGQRKSLLLFSVILLPIFTFSGVTVSSSITGPTLNVPLTLTLPLPLVVVPLR